MKVLIIDNYDSFTFNLYQMIGDLLQDRNRDFHLEVLRNDALSLVEIDRRHYDRIVLSPGPGTPQDPAYFGVCADVILKLGNSIPILGVCLGMQGIVHCYGGNIVRARMPMHGKPSMIEHDGKGIFRTLPQQIEVMRYHSLVAEVKTLPGVLEMSGWIEDAIGDLIIMGVRHREFPVEGIQFHPESFGTEGGGTILANFLFRSDDHPSGCASLCHDERTTR